MVTSVKLIRDMTGAVLKVKNLDELGAYMNAIVDQDGCMYQLADTEPSLDQATNVREGSEEIDIALENCSAVAGKLIQE